MLLTVALGSSKPKVRVRISLPAPSLAILIIEHKAAALSSREIKTNN